jgi:hypothetical protein
MAHPRYKGRGSQATSYVSYRPACTQQTQRRRREAFGLSPYRQNQAIDAASKKQKCRPHQKCREWQNTLHHRSNLFFIVTVWQTQMSEAALGLIVMVSIPLAYCRK